tara:strand:- start:425 stop:1834 length:1410 start_codon:yes stop_codon:yes gene_type:complete
LSKDQVIDIYLHNSQGATSVSGGPYGSQIIDALTWSDDDIGFARSLIDDLDYRLGIDFALTFDRSISDINIYIDKEINLGSEGRALGLAVSNFSDETGYFWEIFLDRDDFGSQRYFRYGLIHEIAHALGMEHPFSADDGDLYGDNSDAWSSTYPEETVMSYRSPLGDIWPNSLTDNDWQALESHWGRQNDWSSSNPAPKKLNYWSNSSVGHIAESWIRTGLNQASGKFDPTSNELFINIASNTWMRDVSVNRINKVDHGSTDSFLQARQLSFDSTVLPSSQDISIDTSILVGNEYENTLRGLAGWDILESGGGADLIHGGNGRDIIDGGAGSDELHGDFGWNTFKDQQDGSKDLIAIKSDQHLSNWWYGKAGNSPNGEKADFIEGLDATDAIKIIGVFTPDISVVDNVTARGVTGIGIYAKGTLEAVYTGGNLSTSQIQNMTTGDGSTTAMNNQMWSYWGDNTVPPLQT